LSCEPREDAPRRDAVAIVDAFERLSDRCLHSALPDGIGPGAACGETEHRSPAIAWIGGAHQQS
jgi:hypothetical protein